MKFEYDDPDFLNKAAMHFDPTHMMSAYLSPDIPGLLEALNYKTRYSASSGDPALDRKLDMLSLEPEERRVFVIANLCESYGVRTYLELNFEGYNEPKIKYLGPDSGMHSYIRLNKICSSLRRKCMGPERFAEDLKWYGIRFSDCMGGAVDSAKAAISRFIEEGYRVTMLEGRLNPRIVSGDHCNYQECDAHFRAFDGEIYIYGKIPNDFDIERIKAEMSMEPTSVPQLRQLDLLSELDMEQLNP